MLAQFQMGPENFGLWMFGLFGLLFVLHLITAIAANVKKMADKPPPVPHESQYVTHGVLDDFREEQRVELATLREDITGQIDKLDAYTHDAFHRFGQAQQTIMNDLAYVRGWINNLALPRTKPKVPTLRNKDEEHT